MSNEMMKREMQERRGIERMWKRPETGKISDSRV